MVIYKIVNLINGSFYIGQDSKNNPNYLGSGKIIKQAIKKYGKNNFKKIILEECSNLKELSEREIYWIEHENAISKGYNIAKGGNGGDTISKNPNRDKIIKKLSGKTPWNKGKVIGPMSEEEKAKRSKTLKKKYKNKVHHSKGTEPWNKNKKGLQVAWNKGKEAPSINCPHCGKSTSIQNANRWHFDNCKSKCCAADLVCKF